MKLSIKAVLVGCVLSLVGSTVLGMSIGFAEVGLYMDSANPLLDVLCLMVDLVMVTAGGWMAANIARRDAVAHGAVTGLLFITMYWLLELLLSVMDDLTSPAWYHLLATILTIPCATLGGYLRGRKRDHTIGSGHGSAAPIPEP
jgi:putative membrane protein (TIGR04086 family)